MRKDGGQGGGVVGLQVVAGPGGGGVWTLGASPSTGDACWTRLLDKQARS